MFKILQCSCMLLLVISGYSQNERQKEMMSIISTPSKYPVKTIGVLLYNGYQTLDAMGPFETLSEMGGVKVFFIAKEKGPIRNQSGMQVKVDTTISQVKHLDLLVVPGGAAETFMVTQDTAILNWIREIDKGTIYTTSVCTGAWILGAAGLLKDRKATTNWYRAEERLKYYGATFIPQRWVKDGKYWTSAGVTAGIDMSLAIINDLKGERFTQGIMLNLEYDPHPPVSGGGVDKSPELIVDMMRQMYDMSLMPLFRKYDKKQN